MKKRATFLIAGILTTFGVVIFNNTDNDIELDSGHILESMKIARSLTKEYRERDLEDSLYITIHHTAGNPNESMDQIAKFHVEKRGWPAIAYHVAVNERGEVHLLNDIEKVSYHDSGENTKSIGIVLVGNYETSDPPDIMIEKVKLVVDAICDVVPIKGIRGHRDTSPTLCPGKYAYVELKGIFF